MSQNLTIVEHPLVQHKLTLMRDKACSTSDFRCLLREISQFLAYEITRDLPMSTRSIDTPLCPMDAPVLAGKKLALVSILRAGNGCWMAFWSWCRARGSALSACIATRKP